jgi:cytochrome c biogenesis factor
MNTKEVLLPTLTPGTHAHTRTCTHAQLSCAQPWYSTQLLVLLLLPLLLLPLGWWVRQVSMLRDQLVHVCDHLIMTAHDYRDIIIMRSSCRC